MSDPWKYSWPARLVLKAVAPRLVVPDRWNAAEFASQGTLLIKAIVRLSRLSQKRAYPYLARKTRDIFQDQLEAVIRLAVARSGVRSIKADVQISLVANEALWMRAIEEVFSEAGIEIITELIPPLQSVMGQAYSRVSSLLAVQTTQAGTQRLASQAREIASQITRINDTTRNIFEREVRRSIQDGLTVQEIAQRLREVMPDLARPRISTIARTELNNAWNQGTIASFEESSTLTHISVIGCESREVERWNDPSYQAYMYRGQSTCLAQDVPVEDMRKLVYHPNHTGSAVPSRFRNEDGTVEKI